VLTLLCCRAHFVSGLSSSSMADSEAQGKAISGLSHTGMYCGTLYRTLIVVRVGMAAASVSVTDFLCRAD
jgi:hypothetical protein